MSNLKYKEYAEYLQGDEPGYRDDLDVQEILDHLSLILAKDLFKRMKNATADPPGPKGGGANA